MPKRPPPAILPAIRPAEPGKEGGMIYETLGIPTRINAAGTVTRLSGGLMHPDVAEAMRQASLGCVDMLDMQAAACRAIRAATGAEAGIVTSGASAAVLLGTAACLAGLDPGRMNRLPEVADGRRDFIVVRSQRNMYDRALVVAGARLVEVGIPDRYSGPGIRDAGAWEIEDAIGPDTAGIYYLAQSQSKPALRDIAAIARRHGLPVLVDAAAQLPPASNLRAYLDEGADLVCFSGGKPPASWPVVPISLPPPCCRCSTWMSTPPPGRRRANSPPWRSCAACRITASAGPAKSARRRSRG